MSANPKRDVTIFLVAVIILMVLPLTIGEYQAYLIRIIGIYTIAALGLNVFMGFCGQINLGAAAFFCIGAYAPTILQEKLGWHYLMAFPAGMVFNFLVAWGISWPLLRLRGHAMAIGTLSLAIAVYLVADRFVSLTGGGDGTVIPPMALFGHTMGNIFYYYFIWAFVVAGFLVCHFLANSSVGRSMKAVREDEVAAAALGVDVNRYKMVAWLVSGVFGGVAGALYPQQEGFLSPTTFNIMSNVTLLLMIIVGGLGTNTGALIGSVIMILLSFLLVTIENYTLLVNGLVLFIVLRFLPDGVMGSITRLFRYIYKKKQAFS